MSASTRKHPDDLGSSLQKLELRHRALLAQLADVGLVVRGSITKRMAPCGRPNCRCKADPPMLHGPYYLWTRKVAGKTVSAHLQPEQAALCREWNRNMRKFDRIVEALQAIGLEAMARLRDS